MKDLWIEDEAAIQQEVDSLVQNKVELLCGRRGASNVTKLPVIGKTLTKSGPVFILLHPHEPSCDSESCVFYYHSKGNPLRVFECKRLKQADKYVGFEYPKQIYNIHRRKFERVSTPDTSSASFCFAGKQRIFKGTVGDISLAGAKIVADLPGTYAKGTKLSNITLNICYRISKAQVVLVIPEAELIWSKGEKDVTNTIGIQFTLSVKDNDALANYIDFRIIEESYPAKRNFF